ncbi:hypothetical protein ACOME3_003125 [Neoechinorhynchus agilis]
MKSEILKNVEETKKTNRSTKAKIKQVSEGIGQYVVAISELKGKISANLASSDPVFAVINHFRPFGRYYCLIASYLNNTDPQNSLDEFSLIKTVSDLKSELAKYDEAIVTLESTSKDELHQAGFKTADELRLELNELKNESL